MTEVVDELSAAGAGGRRPGGVVAVAAGLGVFGAATYGYLGIAGNALGTVAFAPLSVVWTLLNAVGIGLFLPFEQELGRVTAAGRAVGRGSASTVRLAAWVAAGILGAVALLAAVLHGTLTARLFAGAGVMVPLLVGALAGMALSYVLRGLLAGNGSFTRYGAQLAVDGALRVAAAAVLWALGVEDVVPYALVLVAAPLVAALVTTPWGAGVLVRPGPPARAREVTTALGVLVVASLASQLLANAGPLVVQVLVEPGAEERTAQFLAALVIARVPVFLFAAVQAVLLPGLAAQVAAGDRRGFLRRLGLVTGVTAGLAVAGVAAVAVAGDLVVEVLFGPDFRTGGGLIVLIAVSGAAFMLAQLAAQGLLALGGDRWVVTGWLVGLVALVAACLVPGDPSSVAAVALVVGAVAALVLLGVALAVRTARWRATVREGAPDA
ncbi:hypothetical protein [Cellulomonas sp.]|uniref:hypothetical protein n=1 Tax=Cellulomonas sp. TaxID=40001 RepID=UPI0028117E12|nr:hypothetical protein [Cellulomonas sp.]